MPVVLKGFPQTEARIKAIGARNSREAMMRKAGLAVVGEMKLRIPRKTSVTGASLHVGTVTDTSAEVVGSKVAAYLDSGTGLYGPLHHRILPTHGRFLAWKTGASVRLSGRPRKGTRGSWVVVRSTAGMKPRPYIAAAVRAATTKIGQTIVADIISRWNDAA